jgi:hypothetical protein
MHRQVKGILRDGNVQLAEKVDAPDRTEVIVSVPIKRPENRPITLGMFAKELADLDETQEEFSLDKEWERSWQRLENQ